MDKFNPVGWFEIYMQHMERAQKFYETVLGIRMTELPNPTTDELRMMMFTAPDENAMERGGSTGALVQMAGFPSGGNSTLVYFMSEDCSVEEARVEAAGGKIFKPKFPIGPHGFISLCTDTEGNMFGVHSMK
jgi:predicted enzyme related to lactoylglutathione lyase